MAGYEGGFERMWDEYDWERFLQQQDQRTEKYMELLEKYIDDPNRDEIIAREMGWTPSSAAERLSAVVSLLIGASEGLVCLLLVDPTVDVLSAKAPLPSDLEGR